MISKTRSFAIPIVILVFCLSSNALCAKTTLIHAVGLSSSSEAANHLGFFSETMAVLRACKAMKIADEDCLVFGDHTAKNHGNHQTLSEFAQRRSLDPARIKDLSRIKSPSTRVLESFKEALIKSKAGDQVVFSLDNHGSPGIFSHSCIFLGKGAFDKICEDDVLALLKKYKKPGVKVFVQANACFSGAFASLSSREVCTYVSASQFKEGHTNKADDFWLPFLTKKKAGKPLSIAEFRRKSFLRLTYEDGGGFGSEVIHTRLCTHPDGLPRVSYFDKPKKEVVEFYQNLRKHNSDVSWYLKSYENSVQSCFIPESSVLLTPNHPVAQLLEFLNTEVIMPKALAAIDRAYCAAPDTVPLCNAIEQYKAHTLEIYEAVAQLKTALKEFENLNKKMGEKDDEILRIGRGKSEVLEADRGELLETSLLLKQSIAAKVNAILNRTSGLSPILEQIWEGFCLDTTQANTLKETALNVANAINKLVFTFSPVVMDMTPSQKSDLDDAKACEESFVFP